MSALKNIKELDTFRAIFIWMYSNFLASPQLLRKCVFYLSIFTQSSRIRPSRLVRRWIAEGYSEGNDSNSNVEYAEKLIHDLANIGMMEYSQHTPGEASCQINSFFLEYVISQETEENIFLPLEISVLKGEADQNLRHAKQHLVIGSTWRRDEFVFAHLDFSRLRSLTVAREWRSFLISDKMKVLRILDLEDTNVTNEDIEQVVKILPRLKFLGLRRCIKVSDLPDSLGNLRQLQTLDIRHTSVTKLPDSITKLQELQYIRAGARVAFVEEQPSVPRRRNYVWCNRERLDACDGIVVPYIGALKALHTLGVVNVGRHDGKERLKELKNLNQLNKLGVSGINRKNFKELVSAIEGNSSLESLTLQLHKDNNFECTYGLEMKTDMMTWSLADSVVNGGASAHRCAGEKNWMRIADPASIPPLLGLRRRWDLSCLRRVAAPPRVLPDGWVALLLDSESPESGKICVHMPVCGLGLPCE
nr:unnamed protein product [Digitaria exilis]